MMNRLNLNFKFTSENASFLSLIDQRENPYLQVKDRMFIKKKETKKNIAYLCIIFLQIQIFKIDKKVCVLFMFW